MRIGNARRTAAAGAALAVLVLGAAYYRHEHPAAPLVPGQRFVALDLESIGGRPASLQPAQHARIINIFASWCPPCRMEAPAFAAFAARAQRRGIEVVGIDQQESGAAAERFAQDFSLRYPVYVDPTNVTRRVLGARMIPMTIYVDDRNVIRWEHAGPLTAHDLAALAQTARGND